ncbi:MAG: phosphotransferase [Pseudonocardiaceae bacterium]
MSTNHPGPLDADEVEVVHSVLEKFFPTSSSSLRSIGLMGGGRFNRNYRIDMGARKYVLRRYDLNTSVRTIKYEHDLLDHLPSMIHTAAIAKPHLSASNDTIVSNSGRHYALFPFLPGSGFGGGSPHLLREAGRTLAAYHNAAQTYVPEPRQRHEYGTVARLDWAVEYSGGLSKLWQNVIALPLETRHEKLAHESVEFLRDEDRSAQEMLSDKVYSEIPCMVIHGDFGAQNILVSGSRVSGVLDFDLTAWDARAYDLAAAIVWFSEDDKESPSYTVSDSERRWSLNAERGARFCEGYLRELERPLCKSVVDLLSWFMRRFLFWTAIWHLDLLAAGRNWYPHEFSGLISCLRWFQIAADSFVASVMRYP